MELCSYDNCEVRNVEGWRTSRLVKWYLRFVDPCLQNIARIILYSFPSRLVLFPSTFQAVDQTLRCWSNAESVQRINFGCHCGATDHGVFVFKQILRDHGRDALGWARQWEKFSIKEARLASKLAYYLACQILGLWPHNLQFVPSSGNLSNRGMSPNHSRDVLQARINEVSLAYDRAIRRMKLELESCRLALYPATFHTAGRTIRCRSRRDENAETAYLTYRLQQLQQQKKAKEKNQVNQ